MLLDTATALSRFTATHDAEAFAALLHEHRGMVESTCAGVLGRNSPELDDAVQETFLKLARSASAIHGSVGAWLHRCARTTALDRWRARRSAPGREQPLERSEDTCPPPDHGYAEQLQIVRECLTELPERHRLVLNEHFVERRALREIARGLGISHVAVRKRLLVGLDLLRSRCVRRGVGVAALALLLGEGDGDANEATAGSRSLERIGLTVTIASTAAALITLLVGGSILVVSAQLGTAGSAHDGAVAARAMSAASSAARATDLGLAQRIGADDTTRLAAEHSSAAMPLSSVAAAPAATTLRLPSMRGLVTFPIGGVLPDGRRWDGQAIGSITSGGDAQPGQDPAGLVMSETRELPDGRREFVLRNSGPLVLRRTAEAHPTR